MTARPQSVAVDTRQCGRVLKFGGGLRGRRRFVTVGKSKQAVDTRQTDTHTQTDRQTAGGWNTSRHPLGSRPTIHPSLQLPSTPLYNNPHKQLRRPLSTRVTSGTKPNKAVPRLLPTSTRVDESANLQQPCRLRTASLCGPSTASPLRPPRRNNRAMPPQPSLLALTSPPASLPSLRTTSRARSSAHSPTRTVARRRARWVMRLS